MLRFFLFFSCFYLIKCWIPLTRIDTNRIKTPIFIKNKEYFIDTEYNIYNYLNQPLKTKIENHLIWFKENSSNRMISEVKNRKEKPCIIEVPYEWENIITTLFLSVPYCFPKKEYSTEKINTHRRNIIKPLAFHEKGKER